MYTGYFGKVKSYSKTQGLKFISIVRFNRFWSGETYMKLAPPANIIKIEDVELYTKLYKEQVLDELNPAEVYAELGENTVLLCYEKWSDIETGKTFCHRRIIAEWLEENLGIEVKELEDEQTFIF